ncbi:MAG: DUF1805 domain-containing protein [Victivallaceae bacterium]|nr:DUF1805 domain-containing protein [Victivallaceae bacterium]
MMEKVFYDGHEFDGFKIETPKGVILLLRAPHGMLGCGYFSVETADRIGDALAIVSGVKNFEDMLSSPVKSVSGAAVELGVAPGINGAQALLKFL